MLRRDRAAYTSGTVGGKDSNMASSAGQPSLQLWGRLFLPMDIKDDSPARMEPGYREV